MGLILARKNTRITLLYSDENKNSPWSAINQSDQVDQALNFARQEFGASGTQADRRWFYRVRDELYWVKLDQTATGWRNVPRVRYWCDIYFRDPKDATWFQLRKDSSLCQTC
jgi:hypothetical protein